MTSLRQWIKAFPESPAPRRWFFAGSALVVCAVLAVLGLLLAGAPVEASATALRVGVLVIAVCTLISPLPSTIAFAVLLQVAATNTELQSPVVFFGTLAVATNLSLCLSPAASGLCAVALWYLALTRVSAGEFIPDDVEPSAILGAFIIVVWTGGLVIRETLINKRRDSEKFQQQIEDERDRAVKALHGSVAASLTSVVLRSESMAMNAPENSRQDSLLIAEDARRAMREVRELIRFMRTNDESEFASDDYQGSSDLLNHLLIIVGKIRSHGFSVIESGINEAVLSGIQIQNGYAVFRELQTNILKYADQTKPIIVAAVRDEEVVTIAIQNTVADYAPDVAMTTEIGLTEAVKLVKRDGGTLSFSKVDSTWRSELTFPLAKRGNSKERK
ncbi:histidine kinase [Corynebacterium sp. Marseille-P3884]|uniref:sensor histidine kinase n=1 Tax=Corynebacterium sp. Marseille-P3884 TaxID=2495409 RepID=UPI001B3246AD|nr:hypothetical protein [Corynebacterium sp. Marseille-P3884]